MTSTLLLGKQCDDIRFYLKSINLYMHFSDVQNGTVVSLKYSISYTRYFVWYNSHFSAEIFGSYSEKGRLISKYAFCVCFEVSA